MAVFVGKKGLGFFAVARVTLNYGHVSNNLSLMKKKSLKKGDL